MRILFISHYFYPEPNFFACMPFAKMLADRGHDVEVLTGFPHYPRSKLFEGYKIKFLQRETVEGLAVTRIPLYPSHDGSTMKRVLCYVTFALSASTIGMIASKKADIVFVGEGPGTIGLVGCAARFFKRTSFVPYILDLWPETLEATGMLKNKIALKCVGKMMDHIYKHADRIVASTPGYKQLIEARGVPAEKVDLIYGWCNDADFEVHQRDERFAEQLGMSGKFNIVFAGNMGKAQALGSVIDAAAIVKKSCPDIQFVFVGDGVDVEMLKGKTAEQNLDNVRFIPRQPISEIGKVLKLADVLLVHLRDDYSYKITIPSKTVASMSVGRPLLAGVGGDTADLIEESNAGINCQPENPQSIADAAIKMRTMPRKELESMGQDGYRYYQTQISSKIAVAKFEKIFQEVVARRKRR